MTRMVVGLHIYAGGNDKIIIAEGAEAAMSFVESEPNATIYITRQHEKHTAL